MGVGGRWVISGRGLSGRHLPSLYHTSPGKTGKGGGMGDGYALPFLMGLVDLTGSEPPPTATQHTKSSSPSESTLHNTLCPTRPRLIPLPEPTDTDTDTDTDTSTPAPTTPTPGPVCTIPALTLGSGSVALSYVDLGDGSATFSLSLTITDSFTQVKWFAMGFAQNTTSDAAMYGSESVMANYATGFAPCSRTTYLTSINDGSAEQGPNGVSKLTVSNVNLYKSSTVYNLSFTRPLKSGYNPLDSAQDFMILLAYSAISPLTNCIDPFTSASTHYENFTSAIINLKCATPAPPGTPAPVTPAPPGTPSPGTPAPTTPAPTPPTPPVTPNCKPASGIDFSTIPVGYCHQMAQMINNVSTGNYSFYFNWCTLGYQEACRPSYVVQGNVGSYFCDRNFTGWTTGMTYSAQQQQVSYTVNDGMGSTGLITVTCNASGASDGSLTCPKSYIVTPLGSNKYSYVVNLTSKAACVNPAPLTPTPGTPAPQPADNRVVLVSMNLDFASWTIGNQNSFETLIQSILPPSFPILRPFNYYAGSVIEAISVTNTTFNATVTDSVQFIQQQITANMNTPAFVNYKITSVTTSTTGGGAPPATSGLSSGGIAGVVIGIILVVPILGFCFVRAYKQKYGQDNYNLVFTPKPGGSEGDIQMARKDNAYGGV